MQSVERAPTTASGLWSRLPAHTLFGALGVGLIALVLSHPAVMALAGLDIAAQRPGARMIDRAPTGTIASQKTAETPRAKIGGVIGLRAAIREQR
ncbi:MAG: hypothetical protein U1E30_09615 [Rhodoblastus sp.]|jgi:hypothetical protein